MARYDLVDCDVVRKLISDFNLPREGTNRDRIDRLDSYFRSLQDTGETVLQCDICGFHSTDRYDICPFCGTDEEHPFVEIREEIQQKKLYFEEDLDALMDRLARALPGMGVFYRIGKLLEEICRKKLWMLRRTSTGARVYDSFKKWVLAETGFSYMTARRFVRIAETITREQWNRDVAPNLLSEIENHHFKDVFGDASPGRSQLGYEPVLRHLEDQGHAIEIKELEQDEEHLTVRLEQEDGTVEYVRAPKALIRRPARYNKKAVDPKNQTERIDLDMGFNRYRMRCRMQPDEDARSLSDDPWFEIPLSGTVSIVVRIVKTPSGRLDAFCEVKKIR